jgi:phosphoglycerate dehydrogenase-like enzyme
MEREPLPSESPLCRMDNVVLTPHMASYTVEAVEMLYRLSAAIAADLISGRWVPTIVNPEVREKAEARWGAYR